MASVFFDPTYLEQERFPSMRARVKGTQHDEAMDAFYFGVYETGRDGGDCAIAFDVKLLYARVKENNLSRSIKGDRFGHGCGV